MEEDFFRDHPELRPFVLSDVQITGTTIGGGAYGQVEEVAFPVEAAAKTIHAILQGGPNELSKAAAEFVRECQLMSTVRHPNVVQFLGVAFFPGSRLPALVMERLLTSLHDLLDPDTPPPPGAPTPLAFFSVVLKCSVLHNVACGLAYLHGRSPPVIHRDLSARNFRLNSEMVAKIADLGVARIVPRMRAAATMTTGPGASVYMPPEASAPAESNTHRQPLSRSFRTNETQQLPEGQLVGQMLLQRLATGATGVKQARYRRRPTRGSEALVLACTVHNASVIVRSCC